VTAESDAYEELTRTLYGRLAAAQGISTVRLERDVRVPGKATRHQIDVLWEFIDPATGDEQVVFFECRHYKSPINQGRLLEFKAVLEDCAAYEGSDGVADANGVMVTLTGYQIGAKRVADTYGIEIVELRSPLRKDLVGRVNEIKVAMTLRTPVLDNFAVEPVDLAERDGASQVAGLNWDFEIEDADGTRRPLLHVLTAGELNSHDSRRARCTVSFEDLTRRCVCFWPARSSPRSRPSPQMSGRPKRLASSQSVGASTCPTSF